MDNNKRLTLLKEIKRRDLNIEEVLSKDIDGADAQLILGYLYDNHCSKIGEYETHYITRKSDEVKSKAYNKLQWNFELKYYKKEVDSDYSVDSITLYNNEKHLEYAKAQLSRDFLELDRESRSISELIYYRDLKGVASRFAEIQEIHIPALLSLNHYSLMENHIPHYKESYGSFLDYMLKFHFKGGKKLEDKDIDVLEMIIKKAGHHKLRTDYLSLTNEKGETFSDLLQPKVLKNERLQKLQKFINDLLTQEESKGKLGLSKFVQDSQNTHDAIINFQTEILVSRIYNRYQKTLINAKELDNLFTDMVDHLDKLLKQNPNDKLLVVAKHFFNRNDIKNDKYNISNLQKKNITIKKILVGYYLALSDKEMLLTKVSGEREDESITVDDAYIQDNKKTFFEHIAYIQDENINHTGSAGWEDTKCIQGAWDELSRSALHKVKEQIAVSITKEIIDGIVVQTLTDNIDNIKDLTESTQIILYEWSQIGYSEKIDHELSKLGILDSNFKDVILKKCWDSIAKVQTYNIKDEKKDFRGLLSDDEKVGFEELLTNKINDSIRRSHLHIDFDNKLTINVEHYYQDNIANIIKDANNQSRFSIENYFTYNNQHIKFIDIIGKDSALLMNALEKTLIDISDYCVYDNKIMSLFRYFIDNKPELLPKLLNNKIYHHQLSAFDKQAILNNEKYADIRANILSQPEIEILSAVQEGKLDRVDDKTYLSKLDYSFLHPAVDPRKEQQVTLLRYLCELPSDRGDGTLCKKLLSLLSAEQNKYMQFINALVDIESIPSEDINIFMKILVEHYPNNKDVYHAFIDKDRYDLLQIYIENHTQSKDDLIKDSFTYVRDEKQYLYLKQFEFKQFEFDQNIITAKHHMLSFFMIYEKYFDEVFDQEKLPGEVMRFLVLFRKFKDYKVTKSRDLDNDLIKAINIGYFERVVEIIDKGGAKNLDSALREAARYGYLEIAILLIDKGGAKNRYNESLWEAVIRGHLKMVELLINKGAKDLDSRALREAAVRGHLKMAILLIDKGGAKDLYSRALRGAVRHGHLEMVELLIDKGGDKDLDNTLGIAARCGNNELVELLIDKGGAKDLDSALGEAADQGHLEIAILLIDKGGAKDLDSRALEIAVRHGHLEVVKLLIDKGGAKDLYSRALREAVRRGDLKMVELLIDKGVVKDLYSALQRAEKEGSTKVVELLQIRIVVECNHPERVDFFLKQDISERARNAALVRVVELNNIVITKILLEHDADPIKAGIIDQNGEPKIEGIGEEIYNMLKQHVKEREKVESLPLYEFYYKDVPYAKSREQVLQYIPQYINERYQFMPTLCEDIKNRNYNKINQAFPVIIQSIWGQTILDDDNSLHNYQDIAKKTCITFNVLMHMYGSLAKMEHCESDILKLNKLPKSVLRLLYFLLLDCSVMKLHEEYISNFFITQCDKLTYKNDEVIIQYPIILMYEICNVVLYCVSLGNNELVKSILNNLSFFIGIIDDIDPGERRNILQNLCTVYVEALKIAVSKVNLQVIKTLLFCASDTIRNGAFADLSDIDQSLLLLAHGYQQIINDLLDNGNGIHIKCPMINWLTKNICIDLLTLPVQDTPELNSRQKDSVVGQILDAYYKSVPKDNVKTSNVAAVLSSKIPYVNDLREKYEHQSRGVMDDIIRWSGQCQCGI